MPTVTQARQKIQLKTTNTINLRGEVTSESMNKLSMKIYEKYLLNPGKPIYLVLNTPGGSLDAGSTFIESVKFVPNLHTITIRSYSMGHIIVQSLPGKRYIISNGTMMAHRPSGTFRGTFGDGIIETNLKFWTSIWKRFVDISAKRIGITPKEYNKRIKDEWWTTATQSVEQNTADEIVDLRCSMKLIKSQEEKVVETLFGTRVFTFSGCPLIEYPI